MLALLVILALIWLVSPLILIPLSISLGRKSSKLSAFVSELFRQSRISSTEYSSLEAERKVYEEAKPFESSAGTIYEEPVTAPKTVTVSVTEAHTDEKPKPAEQTVKMYDFPKKEASVFSFEEKRTGSAAILFAIGAAFVILAGFIFSTAIWVYLSDLARTGIIALAGMFFFGISALAGKKFKLENTSSAFYILGTVFTSISFITAGIFRLFGEWFSVSGEGGCLFFAASSFIITGFSALRMRSSGKKLYEYTSIYTFLTGFTLCLAQLSDSYEGFSLIISLVGVLSTAALWFIGKTEKYTLRSSVRNAVIALRAAYSAIAFPCLIVEFFELSTLSIVLTALFLTELTVYGVIKKSGLLLGFQSVFAFGFIAEICAKLSDNGAFNETTAIFIFALALTALCVLYRLRRELYTPFAEVLFSVIPFILGYFLITENDFAYGITLMLTTEALMLSSALSFTNIFRGLSKISLPLPFIITAWGVADFLDREYELYCHDYALTICAALFTAIAYVCSIAIKGDRRFVPTKYSFETAAAVILFYVALSADTAPCLAAVLLLCVVVFAIMHTSGTNIHSAIPMASFMTAVSELIDVLFENYRQEGDASVITSIILCSVFTLASRMLYSKSLMRISGDKTRRDTLQTGILMCAFLANHSSVMFSYRARVFIILLELAVFAANLWRSENTKSFNACAVTVSSALVGLALINRPFMLITEDVISSKVTLSIIAIFGFVVRKIWRRKPEFAESFSSGVYMLAYIMLLFDALANQTLFNTLIVLSVSLVIMLYSFMKKKKRWFISSAIGLTGLTLYITKDFLTEIDWWIYLLLAGILLISIATANEYFKEKGSSVKKKAGRFFEDWTW